MENTYKTYTVYAQQTWLDIAMILYGDAAQAQALAWQNGGVISQNPSLGQSLQVPNLETQMLNVHSLQARASQPATALNPQTSAYGQACQGISCWTINDNFEIQPSWPEV
jgi:hypothetical protein